MWKGIAMIVCVVLIAMYVDLVLLIDHLWIRLGDLVYSFLALIFIFAIPLILICKVRAPITVL